MPVVLSLPKFKMPPASSDDIEVIHFGPDSHFTSLVFLYADVLEELQFNAKDQNSYGMLLGTYSIIPIEVRKNEPGEALDFIEITAFKDIWPSENALDYAGYLRKQRDFRPPSDGTTILGLVVLQKTFKEPSLEELMVMRSYFADQIQIALYITGECDQPRVYVIGDTLESFAEIGFSLVKLASEALPFKVKE